MKPPVAKRIPYFHEIHGDRRQDEYHWLRDREDPEVIKYLEDENRYHKAIMCPLKDQVEIIFNKLVERIPEKEEDVPVQNGPYFYYSRDEKKKQYPIYARKKASSRDELATASEEIILDVNELAKDDGYLSVTVRRVSPDHRFLAYLENRDGTDRYTLYIKNLKTGELLPDTISNVYIYSSVEWDHAGEYIFYVTVDETQRPYRLWRHKIGTDPEEDELIYEEADPTFMLFIFRSQSGKFIFVTSHANTTTEVRLIDAESPLSPLRLLEKRRKGIEYDVEHWGDDLLILTNEGAKNFQIQRCPLSNLEERDNLFEYNENRYFQYLYPFRRGLVIAGRENGLTQVWIYKNNKLVRLNWDEPIYTVSVVDGQSYDADEVLIQYESLLTPKTTFGINLETLEKTCLQVAPVSGEYDPSLYEQKQLWAEANDGVKIPYFIVSRKGALDSGPAPLILYAYGSYGENLDPYFSPYRLPVLDQGVVFAYAQVRGGSEMGRQWYEDGKVQKKKNTFTDFIAVAKDLIKRGFTTPEQMAARGGSAGGLLVGAVANMAGDLFKVIIPEVPFVDVINTMLDENLPLTTLEWDEWGDPRKPEDYFYIKSYSPYDNVKAKAYPHMYVTAGLNDPRVGYWEPAKWVARLRALKTDDNILVLKTNMGAGHFGSSGRYNQLREEAECYAFLLDKLGVVFE